MAEFLALHAQRHDGDGRQMVVRIGHLPERDLVTGIGPVRVKQPRVDDRRLSEEGQPCFSSAILPRYLRRVASVDDLIPVLYLKGYRAGTSARRCRRSWERGHRG